LRAAYRARTRASQAGPWHKGDFSRGIIFGAWVETTGWHDDYPTMVVAIVRSVRQLALKIASYGVMHLIVAMLVAWAITRDWRVAVAIGFVEPFFQTLAYSIHDRVWHRIEHRRRLSRIEETSEAFTARLEIMDADEQRRAHGHATHSHALPRSWHNVAAKTVTYGVMHFVVAVAVAFALSGDIRLALAIGVIEPLVQSLFFTVHDRVWTRIEARRTHRQASPAV